MWTYFSKKEKWYITRNCSLNLLMITTSSLLDFYQDARERELMDWSCTWRFYRKDYKAGISISISKRYRAMIFLRLIFRGSQRSLAPFVIAQINQSPLSMASPSPERKGAKNSREKNCPPFNGCKDIRAKRDRDLLSSCHRQKSKTYHRRFSRFYND